MHVVDDISMVSGDPTANKTENWNGNETHPVRYNSTEKIIELPESQRVEGQNGVERKGASERASDKKDAPAEEENEEENEEEDDRTE